MGSHRTPLDGPGSIACRHRHYSPRTERTARPNPSAPHAKKNLDVRFRCTVDIRIMVGHYARDEIFVFCCHFTRSGSLRLADWSLLISFYVSRQSHVMWRESHFMCRPTEQPAYSQLSAPPV